MSIWCSPISSVETWTPSLLNIWAWTFAQFPPLHSSVSFFFLSGSISTCSENRECIYVTDARSCPSNLSLLATEQFLDCTMKLLAHCWKGQLPERDSTDMCLLDELAALLGNCLRQYFRTMTYQDILTEHVRVSSSSAICLYVVTRPYGIFIIVS